MAIGPLLEVATSHAQFFVLNCRFCCGYCDDNIVFSCVFVRPQRSHVQAPKGLCGGDAEHASAMVDAVVLASSLSELDERRRPKREDTDSCDLASLDWTTILAVAGWRFNWTRNGYGCNLLAQTPRCRVLHESRLLTHLRGAGGSYLLLGLPCRRIKLGSGFACASGASILHAKRS